MRRHDQHFVKRDQVIAQRYRCRECLVIETRYLTGDGVLDANQAKRRNGTIPLRWPA